VRPRSLRSAEGPGVRPVGGNKDAYDLLYVVRNFGNGPDDVATAFRELASESEVRIYDYVDSEVPMLYRMFERRLRGYRAIGYEMAGKPLAPSGPEDGTVVVYDEEQKDSGGHLV
jgi:hypothetical protein